MPSDSFLLIGVGAARGAWLRWAFGIWLNPVLPTVPLGALSADPLGGFISGGMMRAADPPGFSPAVRLLVVTGFLGGLTTFSTFSAETAASLLQARYQWAQAAVLTHVAGSLCVLWQSYLAGPTWANSWPKPTRGDFSMNGTYLRFYVHENVRHRHQLLYEWLLQHARGMGVHGGSVFRSVEGFGRHGVLHSAHFFELAGQLTMEIEFILTNEMADRLLESLRHEDLSLVFARLPAEFGIVGQQAHKSRIPV